MSNKYIPHQGKREQARRLKQIRRGILQGPQAFIPTSTRMGAVGLIGWDNLHNRWTR